jgi:VWFA-related protein
MKCAIVKIGLVFLLLSAGALSAQQVGGAVEPVPPSIKITAQTVVIDAVVTDHSGKVIPDLTPEDFRVFENGIPQKINFFEPHLNTATAKPDDVHPLPPNTFSNTQQVTPAGALNVLLIDSLNTNTADRIGVRHQLLDLVDHLPQGSPIAVFELADKLSIVQGFTTDPVQLRAALTRFALDPSQPLTQALSGGNSVQGASVSSLSSVAASGAGGAQGSDFMSSLAGGPGAGDKK